MHAGAEHRQQRIEHLALHPRAATGHPVEPRHHDRPHDLRRMRIADSRRMAEQDVALKRRLVGVGDALVLELADVGVEPVDRLLTGDEPVDDISGASQP